METADTTKALRAALEAARQERDALSERLSTIDQLIADLDQAIDSGRGAGTSRTAGKRAGRKAAGKRAGRKAAGKRATRKTTAKRGGRKQTTRKASTGKRTGRRQAAGRTDRAVEIVTGAAEPMTTGEVRARLAQEEPEVSSKLVSAALTYAQRKGRIGKTGDGRWTRAA